MRREVCEATRVLGEQSDEAMGLRMACLDRIAGRFAGLTDEATQGRERVWAGAGERVGAHV